MTLQGATVLVSGGTGFLGSHLVRRLSKEGARVHLLLRQESSLTRLSDLRAVPDFSRVELDDAEGLRSCLRNVRPDVVCVAAGSTADRGRGHPGDQAVHRSYFVNVMGTLHLLQAISFEVPGARVIRVGSLAEYGVGLVPFREDQREEPASTYASGQLAATYLGQSFHRQFGLAITTIRLALTYGPAQSDHFLIPSLIRACLDGRPFDLTSADHTRDLIYVDDAIDALIAAATTARLAGDVVNIGSGREYRIADVAALIVRLTGASIAIRESVTSTDRAGLQRLVCDPARARNELGWSARTPLDEGLQRTIAWYKSNNVS